MDTTPTSHPARNTLLLLGLQAMALGGLWSMRGSILLPPQLHWSGEPELVLVVLAYGAATALAICMCVGTLLHALGLALRVPALLRAGAALLPGKVRELVSGATAVAAAGTMVAAGPALALPPPGLVPGGASASSVIVQPGPAPSPTPSPFEGTGVPDTRDSADGGLPTSDLDASGEVASGSGELRTHVVTSGEHLWSIAEDELRRRTDRRPTAGEITLYWREVITDNRGRIASGDPDLIFPGERIVLPD